MYILLLNCTPSNAIIKITIVQLIVTNNAEQIILKRYDYKVVHRFKKTIQTRFFSEFLNYFLTEYSFEKNFEIVIIIPTRIFLKKLNFFKIAHELFKRMPFFSKIVNEFFKTNVIFQK